LENEYYHDHFQIDHIYPQSKIKLETFDNYALSCRLCNRLKRDEEFGERQPNPRDSLPIIKEGLNQRLQDKKKEIEVLTKLSKPFTSK
jgi:CRISPR/Cas system Type II protein with McrA/HNH and RuvC-like nuclease domain